MNDQELQRLYQRMISEPAVARHGDCIAVEDLLELAEGRARSADRLRWSAHVASCPRCRQELILLQAVAEAGNAVVQRRVPALALALAASIALLIGGGVMWRGWQREIPDVMRGEGAGISLVSPAGAIAIAQARILTWNPVPRATSYDVEILESAGAQIFVTSTPDTSVTVPAETRLAPGTEYRWRVTARLADGARPGSRAQEFTILDK